jgi:hypothetical protein
VLASSRSEGPIDGPVIHGNVQRLRIVAITPLSVGKPGIALSEA